MKSHSISNRDDVVDSRDVIARLEELRDEREALKDIVDEREAELTDEPTDNLKSAAEEAQADLDEWNDDYGEELKTLEALNEEGEAATSDWPHGAAIIRESYFVEYCIEMVQDIGDLPRNIPGYLEIDWDKTADNLRVDYAELDWDGVTYLIR